MGTQGEKPEGRTVTRFAVYTIKTGNIHGTPHLREEKVMNDCARLNSAVGYKQYGVAWLVFEASGRHRLLRTDPEGLTPTVHCRLFPED